jgi:hypothetical protein
VPELGPDTKFVLSSHKAIDEYKEAKEVKNLSELVSNSDLYCVLPYYIYTGVLISDVCSLE